MLPPGGRTRTSSRRPSKSLPRVRSTSCRRRSVHCYGAPQYSAMSSPRTCFCRCSGTLRPRGREPNYSPGCQASLCSTGHQLRFRHPILREVAYAGLPYRRRRELHAQAAEVLETTTSAADRRPEILALHYFVARNYDKAMDYGWRAGERAMARYAPAAAADCLPKGGPGCPTFLGRQPERAFVLPGSAGRCRVLGGPAHRGCRGLPGSAAWRTRSATAGGTSGAQADPGGTTPRPLQQCTAPGESGPARCWRLDRPGGRAPFVPSCKPTTRSAGSIRVATRMPADGRSEASPKQRRPMS